MQLTIEQAELFTIAPGDTVRAFGSRLGIVAEIYDPRSDGRCAVRVIPIDVEGEAWNDMMPFLDELVLVEKHVSSRVVFHEVSDDVAERFANYARAGGSQ